MDSNSPQTLDAVSSGGDSGLSSADAQADFNWQAPSLGTVNYQDSGNGGSFSAQGSTNGPQVQGQAYANAGTQDSTASASAGAQGTVSLVDSNYNVSYSSPSVNVLGVQVGSDTQAQAGVQAGANAFANADVSVGQNTQVDVGAGAYAGAKATFQDQKTLAMSRRLTVMPRSWLEWAAISVSALVSPTGRSV
jgi:hypothetical protein